MPDFAVRTAFTGDSKSLAYAANDGGASIDKFGNKASKAFLKTGKSGSRMLGMLRSIGPAIGIAAGIQFLGKSIEKFGEQEAAVKNVEAGLKSTNNAIGLTSKQLQDMAANIQKAGIFGDEEILQNATAQFLTFGNIGKTNFDRIQRAALDVTAKLYGVKASSEQIRTASIMMGKAMDDPVRGMGAMRRVGISFSKQEEIMVKRMVAANNIVGAQNMMLKLIERQYGGTNEALSKTSAGMERMAKNKVGDTMEELGKQLFPLKQMFFEFAIWLLPKINYALPIMAKFLKSIAPIAIAVAGGFLLYKIALMGAAAWQGIMMAAGWIKYLWMMREFITAATIKQWLWNAAMAANPIGLVVAGITALIAAGVLLYIHFDKVKKVFMEWTKIFDNKVFRTIMLFLMPFITIPILILRNWNKLKEGISNFAGSAYEKFMWIKDGIISFGEAAVSTFEWVGETILSALLAPTNLFITAIVKMMEVVAMVIPVVGDSIAGAANEIKGFQAKMNEAIGSRNLFAPNESAAGKQNLNVSGNVSFQNAPAGTQANINVGTTPLNVEMMGAQ